MLSTPTNHTSTLVKTLEVREQISLGLLLDAVSGELETRNDSDANSMDVYPFLISLNTGMSANPRFVALDEGLENAPGFEYTWEMKSFSHLGIPLVHGWLPSRPSQAYMALERSAQTYEDAQYLMFREEELTEKLQVQGRCLYWSLVSCFVPILDNETCLGDIDFSGSYLMIL